MLTPRRLVVFNLVIFLLGLTVLYSYASTTAPAVPPAPTNRSLLPGQGRPLTFRTSAMRKTGGG
ncbi:MAG: hypothetical protein KDE56_01290 [Anaerolineales bacterium]|nr:hypothetical protein [Anaerolineales bacterium]